MRFLADETIEPIIVDKLHDAGHGVLCLTGDPGRFSQDDIIEKAQQEEAILLTDNEDFNRRIYQTQPTLPGIVVLLFEQEDAEVKARRLLAVIRRFGFDLTGMFTLITPTEVKWKKRKRRQLSREALEGLLAWLDPDGKQAEDQYLIMRGNLTDFFEKRGCPSPDDCVTETFDRVARHIAEGKEVSNFAGLCYGVAERVEHEHQRELNRGGTPLDDLPPSQQPAGEPLEPDWEIERFDQQQAEQDRRLECMRRCLHALKQDERELVVKYYRGRSGVRKRIRAILRKQLGIKANALKLRVRRIVHRKLRPCLEDCLKTGTVSVDHKSPGRSPKP